VTISDFNEFVYDEETFDFITNLELTRDDKALYADWSDTLCDDRFGRLFVLSNAPTKWIKVCLSHLNNHTTSAKCILFEDIVSVPEMMDGAMKPCEEAYTYMESMCDGRGIYVEDNATNFKRSSSISNVLLKSAAHVSTANSKTHMIIKEPRELSLGP
jgi:FMN phosphatase YigB (HAD superfamily)